MGKRDFGNRETKKPKKDAKKATTTTTTFSTPMAVEVVRRGKKPRDDEEQ